MKWTPFVTRWPVLLIMLAIIMTGCEQKGDAEDPFTPDFEHLKKVMQLDKEQITEWLGTDYVVGKSDITGMFPEDGMYYEKYGISILFSDAEASSDTPTAILCNDKADILGAKQKMSFSEIESILGKGEELRPTDFGMYIEVYKFDQFGVWFGAYDRDSIVIEVKIFKWFDFYGDENS